MVVRRTDRTDMMAYQYTVEHLTMQEIGDYHGISRERVRQILQRAYDISGREIFRERVALRRAARGLTPEHEEETFWAKRLAIHSSGNVHPTLHYTDEALLTLLREAAVKYGQTPSTRIWIRDGLKPTPAVFFARFGSWVNACTAAGLEPNKAVRDNYTRQWTDVEMVDSIVEFLLNPTDNTRNRGGIKDYDEWRRQTGADAPSGALIRLHLGSWNEAKKLAVDRIIDTGGE